MKTLIESLQIIKMLFLSGCVLVGVTAVVCGGLMIISLPLLLLVFAIKFAFGL